MSSGFLAFGGFLFRTGLNYYYLTYVVSHPFTFCSLLSKTGFLTTIVSTYQMPVNKLRHSSSLHRESHHTTTKRIPGSDPTGISCLETLLYFKSAFIIFPLQLPHVFLLSSHLQPSNRFFLHLCYAHNQAFSFKRFVFRLLHNRHTGWVGVTRCNNLTLPADTKVENI